MGRLPRVVVPGIAHHVVQRGNYQEQTFFYPGDYRHYLKIMALCCQRWGVEIWAYCLMPNHVHLIAVPEAEDSLRRAVGEAHRRYTYGINKREGRRGHLWQGRFFSYPMDEVHLLAATRYIELNPLRAGMVTKVEEYPWSSAHAHFTGVDDALMVAEPLLRRVPNWGDFLRTDVEQDLIATIRAHEKTGRPLARAPFVRNLESQLQRRLMRATPGRKPRKIGASLHNSSSEIGMVAPISHAGAK